MIIYRKPFRPASLCVVAAVLMLTASGVGAQQQSRSADDGALPYTVVDGRVDERTYSGWRVFHSACHSCHGVGATGTEIAPDLTRRVGVMTENDFIVAVLYRYPIIVGFEPTPGGDLARLRDAFVEQIEKAERGELLMPSWEHDATVRPHVRDLYAYLRARADGAIDEDRPERFSAPSGQGG